MFKELLPIGTVVLLKGASKKVMVTGMKTMLKDDPDKVYDYIGVSYPEGYIEEAGNLLFNQSDINDIIFTGYSNPEREDFLDIMDKIVSGEIDVNMLEEMKKSIESESDN